MSANEKPRVSRRRRKRSKRSKQRMMKKRAKESPLKRKIVVSRDERINPDFPYIVAANGYEFDDPPPCDITGRAAPDDAMLGGLRAPGKTNALRDAIDDDSPYRPG